MLNLNPVFWTWSTSSLSSSSSSLLAIACQLWLWLAARFNCSERVSKEETQLPQASVGFGACPPLPLLPLYCPLPAALCCSDSDFGFGFGFVATSSSYSSTSTAAASFSLSFFFKCFSLVFFFYFFLSFFFFLKNASRAPTVSRFEGFHSLRFYRAIGLLLRSGEPKRTEPKLFGGFSSLFVYSPSMPTLFPDIIYHKNRHIKLYCTRRMHI